MVSSLGNNMQAYFKELFTQKKKIIFFVWVFALYVVGLVVWGWIFDWGRTPLNFHDWADINIPRVDFISDALHYGQLPLHSISKRFLHGMTNRFLALPDVMTSPQMILLYWLAPKDFVIADVFLHYTLGFGGLFLFARKYKLSWLPYTLVFLLFNFNGYIVSHYMVGHATWGGYFIFPLLLLWLTDFMDGVQGWQWAAKMAFLMFYMVLAGSQHHFTWWILFLFMTGLFFYRRIKWIILAIVGGGMMSAVRFLPPLLEINTFLQSGRFTFKGGYASVAELFHSLTRIRGPLEELNPAGGVSAYWEFNVYIGMIGLVFIIIYGLFYWLKNRDKLSWLLLPVIGMTILAIGKTYRFVGLTLIPFFASERITSRMIAVPLVVLIFLAGVGMEKSLQSRSAKLTALLGFVAIPIISANLCKHLTYWNIRAVAQNFDKVVWRFSGNTIEQVNDPKYYAVILFGLLLTLFFCCFFLFMAYKERLRTPK